MLRIISGKAGTGKSSAVMKEISGGVSRREGSYILIVPDQYSHEAQRELCAVCGDSMSLYADVLSFKDLARRLESETGGAATQYLDKGGRLLCMALASDALSSRLKVYSDARRKADIQSMLLSAVDELKAACVDSDMLCSAAEDCGGPLGEKLGDLSLVLEAYDAEVSSGGADPSDRMSILAEKILGGALSADTRVYVDGFTDFTAQELRVIEAMLCVGTELTLCLSCESLERGSEIFELSRRTARRLIAFAKERNIEYTHTEICGESGKNRALAYFSDKLFSFQSRKYEGDSSAIRIFSAPDTSAECELAAAEVLRLVRETGCRWRDIAVAMRGFEDTRLVLESVFRRYGVPLYSARKSDLGSKPLPALISGAYEIAGGGWEEEDVMSYLRTGFAGLTEEECDELENYVFLWSLRGTAWTRDGDWRLHPDGYGKEYTDEVNQRLRRINSLRRRAAAPIAHFAERTEQAHSAREQCEALAELFSELHLAEKLYEKSEKLRDCGREREAQEYAQLWELCVSALEQCAAVLGDTETDRDYFGRLFLSVLSQYDIGTIPASLDSVTAGDFDRMRRRNIRHLIVIGASDSRLPKTEDDFGVFSNDERLRLLEYGIDLGASEDCGIWREFNLIYNCLSLPSETLTLCFPCFDDKGEAQRPSFVITRAVSMLGRSIVPADMSAVRLSSEKTALELAANALHGGGVSEKSAESYFREYFPERFGAIEAAAGLTRGRLSESSVRALYGNNLRLSASRIDKFASCRFSYFMQYGLKAAPREPAGFTPPEMGTFMHAVLETVAREVTERGGFAEVGDDEIEKLTDAAIESYVHETLNDFREKSPRFEYLFRRLSKNTKRIVADMSAELRASDFKPLSFELDFGASELLPPMKLSEGEDSLILTGIADRIDGWLHNDKLYLRVVDYKTGKKSFSLSDVWYGMGLQMLLYLFTLGKNGEKLYGREIVPAGVLYIPARDVLVSEKHNLSDEEIEAERIKGIKRSGLLLDDIDVLHAMEHGDLPRFLPVKFKDGVPEGDSLASAEQLGRLSKHIEETLRGMAQELHRGSIAADPYYLQSQQSACEFCDYFEACHFRDGVNGERARALPKLSATKVWNMLEGGGENG